MLQEAFIDHDSLKLAYKSFKKLSSGDIPKEANSEKEAKVFFFLLISKDEPSYRN